MCPYIIKALDYLDNLFRTSQLVKSLLNFSFRPVKYNKFFVLRLIFRSKRVKNEIIQPYWNACGIIIG